MPPRRKKARKIPLIKKREVISESNKNDAQVINKIKQEFTCANCDKSYKKERDLVTHVKNKSCTSHTVMLKMNSRLEHIKCKECKKIFKFKLSYDNHCENEHSKNPDSVACAHCRVRCPNKKILKKHIQTTHDRFEYECAQCKKRFVRQAHVFRHMAQSGCDGTEIAVYPCEICNKKFSRKDNLMVHLRFQHILKVCYTCKYCPYGTKNFSRLVKHWQENHMDPQKFECDICGKLTSSRSSIAKHLEIHGEKKHVCDVCGYRTFTPEVMKRHVLTHVAEKPHKCDVCGQSYIQKLQLMRHLEKHAGNTCTQCGESFNSKARCVVILRPKMKCRPCPVITLATFPFNPKHSELFHSLLIHEKTHKGVKKLTCPFDGCAFARKEFASNQFLHTHVKTHLIKKDVKCEVCGKLFSTDVHMRRHLSVHRLDRPRRCMYCMSARAYIRGEQLLRHVRRHHPDLFHQHLVHVRSVLGTNIKVDRVKKSELESILNLLDAESDRILEGYGGMDVLYGGIQEQEATNTSQTIEVPIIKTEESPLMSEEELEDNLRKLLSQLIDNDTLQFFGWPDASVDAVLEKVIEHCGARAADRTRWTRVQCLRENTKHLFLYAVEDKNVARMLDTHTIDQIVKHILAQVDDPSD